MIDYSDMINREMQTISATFESGEDREQTIRYMNQLIRSKLSSMKEGTIVNGIKCEQGNDGRFKLNINFYVPAPLDKINVKIGTPNTNQFNINTLKHEASYD